MTGVRPVNREEPINVLSVSLPRIRMVLESELFTAHACATVRQLKHLRFHAVLPEGLLS
jgi:hypothetical protein